LRTLERTAPSASAPIAMASLLTSSPA
jgi:hypothetical protein